MTEKSESGGLSGLIVLALIGYLGYLGFNYIFSDEKDELKEYAKCLLAAGHLGEETAINQINQKMEIFFSENEKELKKYGSWNGLVMLVTSEAADELGVHNKTTEREIYTLVKVYNSCSDFHEQEKISGIGMGLDYYLLYLFL